jgi:hypothetical protein
MTSGGKRKPLKVERGTGAGRGRRILMSAVSLLKVVVANATAPPQPRRDVLTPAACQAGWYSRRVRASAERGRLQGPGRAEADPGPRTLPGALFRGQFRAALLAALWRSLDPWASPYGLQMTSLIPPLMGLPWGGEPAGAALGPFVLVRCSGRIAHHSGVVALLNTFKAQGKDFTVVSFPALAMGCSIPRPPPPKHRPPSWNGYKSGSRQGPDRLVGLLSGASGAAERCGDPVGRGRFRH